MTKSKMIKARVEPALKLKAEAVSACIPNAVTRRALRDARRRKKIETFGSVAAWIRVARSA